MHIAKIYDNCKFNNNINYDNNSINGQHQQFNSKIIKSFDIVCFSGNPIKPYKLGETIEHLGLVIKELSVRNCDTHSDEECYVLFKKYENGGTFRLMKKIPEKLKELSDELKKHPDILEEMHKVGYTIFTPALEQAKQVAPRLVELFDELTITEITYARFNREKRFEKIIKYGYKPINPEDGITTIYKFFLNQKKYANATMEVIMPLFKALTQDGIKRNIIIRASAYNSGRTSPYHLYLKYGFRPLSATAEEVEAHKIMTPKGPRLDPNYPVLMYLPEDAFIYKFLKDKPDLNEINKISPGWFNLND